MLKYILILVIGAFSFTANAQAKLDIELKTGLLLNGRHLDIIDDDLGFDLRNGFSYGIGFDLWWNEKWATSFGYSLGQSFASFRTRFPEGHPISAMQRTVGVLKDRLFYLTVKRSQDITPSTSVALSAGLYYNPYFFDSDDIDYNAKYTMLDRDYYIDSYYIARFNSTNNGPYGALGAQLGFTLSQSASRFGVFSVGVNYGIDLKKSVDQTIIGSEYQMILDSKSGELIDAFSLSNYQNVNRGRHVWQVEFGFKMPCSILLGKG